MAYRCDSKESRDHEEVVKVGEDVPLAGEDGGQEASEDPGEAGADYTTDHNDGAGDAGSRIHLGLSTWNGMELGEMD